MTWIKHLGQALICLGTHKVVAISIREPGPGLQTFRGSISVPFLEVRTYYGALGRRKSIRVGGHKLCLQKTRTSVSQKQNKVLSAQAGAALARVLGPLRGAL